MMILDRARERMDNVHCTFTFIHNLCAASLRLSTIVRTSPWTVFVGIRAFMAAVALARDRGMNGLSSVMDVLDVLGKSRSARAVPRMTTVWDIADRLAIFYTTTLLVGHHTVLGATMSTLKFSVRHGRTAVFKALLKLPEDRRVDAVMDAGGIHTAVLFSTNLDSVRALVEHSRARGPHACKWLVDSVYEACMVDAVHIVDYLLKLPRDHGVDPSTRDNMAFRHAAGAGKRAMVYRLLEEDEDRGIDPSANDNEALCSAATEGHRDIVHLLLRESSLRRGVDPRARNNTPLRNAAERGHTAIVYALLRAGADPAVVDLDRVREAEVGRVVKIESLVKMHLSRR